MRADATIIIPQHNRAELTIATVHALRRAESTAWPVIIVDDGSNPEAVAAVRSALPEVTLHEQAHHGVTRAWNAALRRSTTTYLVFLNNDVQITGAWVDALLEPLRTCSNLLSGVTLRRERAVPEWLLQRIGRSEFAAGWCFAVDRVAALAAGGFDERFRLYFSDTDFQARLLNSPQTRREPAVVERLPLRHAGHCSTRRLPSRREIWRQDRARFIRKWQSIER